MTEDIHEPSLWAGAGTSAILAALAITLSNYIPHATPMLVSLSLSLFTLFCVYQAWRAYDGPLYGGASA